jgi:hypothetical protein
MGGRPILQVHIHKQCPMRRTKVEVWPRGRFKVARFRCQSAPDRDPAYCRIYECYPDDATCADDLTPTDWLSLVAFTARSAVGAVGLRRRGERGLACNAL